MNELPNSTVIELLRRFDEGDDDAFVRLFKAYNVNLSKFVRKECNFSDDAEDLTQDVWIKVSKKAKSYQVQSGTSFSTWLKQVAKNEVIDHYRRQKSRKKHIADEGMNRPDEEEGGADFEWVEDPNADVLTQLEQAQDSEAVRYCIEKLPAKQREAILNVYYVEQSLADAAQDMQCPEGTVKSRLFHAHRQLAQCVERWVRGGRYG